MNEVLQQFEVDREISTYCVSRSFIRECGPDYLIICVPSPEENSWVVDLQNERQEVVALDTLGEAVGFCVQYMMGFESES